MRILVGVALGLGRRIARVVLLPITAYFMVRRGPERRASRAYLARVLGRAPSWLEVARHFHTFAGVTLDRVYFLSDRPSRFDTRLIGIEELHRTMALGRGVLLIGAHVGSFDALRAASTLRPDVTVRVVLDSEHSPALSAILRQLNPDGRPESMRALAQCLQVDPSAITGLVDRLEAKGLVERQPDPGDRRVKALVLTPRGKRVRAHLTRIIDEPPASLRRMSPERLVVLRDALAAIGDAE